MVYQLSMQTLTIGRLLTVEFGQLALGVALAIGDDPGLLASPDGAIAVVVIWIVGPALAICLALQAPDVAVSSLKAIAELEQFCLRWRDNPDGGWPNVQPDFALAEDVLVLAVGFAFTHQLGVEAVAPVQLAPHNAHILHRRLQAMRHHLVLRIDNGLQAQFNFVVFRSRIPFHPTASCLIHAPADTAAVGLAFQTIELVTPFEARTAPFAKMILLHRIEGSAG